MTKKKTGQVSVEKHQIGAHRVEIRKVGQEDQLWIDGRRRKFFVSDDGYTLYDDAYLPPQKSLLEAVKASYGKASK